LILARVLPQTPLGERTLLPKPSSWILRDPAYKGRGGKTGREGKGMEGEGERRRWEGRRWELGRKGKAAMGREEINLPRGRLKTLAALGSSAVRIVFLHFESNSYRWSK